MPIDPVTVDVDLLITWLRKGLLAGTSLSVLLPGWQHGTPQNRPCLYCPFLKWKKSVFG